MSSNDRVAQQGLAADKGRLVLVHTLLSAAGRAGVGCEALVKGGPLQLKPSVRRALVEASGCGWATNGGLGAGAPGRRASRWS